MSVENHGAEKIRRLCGLGLDSHFIVPRIVELLHACIPSCANGYFWVNEDLQISQIYHERPNLASLIDLYFAEYMNSLELEVFDGWESTLHYPCTVAMDQLWKVDRRSFFKHSFYNELYRKIGYHTGLHRPIRVNGKYHGAIQLHRKPGKAEFRAEDGINLDRIARHMEYALSAPSNEKETYCELPSSTGILTVNSSNRIIHYSPGAEKLFFLISEQGLVNPNERNSFTQANALIKNLTRRLLTLCAGRETEPPAFLFSNKWGKFRVTAYLMSPAELGAVDPMVNIHIDHFLPSQILMLTKLEEMPLTSRQKEVCVQIGLNKPYKQIARQLNLALSTIISHKKELFSRLEIKSRHELMGTILYN